MKIYTPDRYVVRDDGTRSRSVIYATELPCLGHEEDCDDYDQHLEIEDES